MFLIIGLGNPGTKYKKTRHNIGFEVLNEFSKENGFPDFRLSKKFETEVSEAKLKKNKIILFKPQTFMNMSGKSVKLFLKNSNLNFNNLFIVHDDIDLPLGKIKIVKNRGSAGHKGVESIMKELKTKDLIRFRVGVNPRGGKPKEPEKFVLKKFTPGEIKLYKESVKKTTEAIKKAIEEGLEKSMAEYN